MVRSAFAAFFPGLLLVSCCSVGAPVAWWPTADGLAAQRALIEQTFAGTDLRADPRALADFRRGRRDSVSAAWWGYDERDATVSLQTSLDSGARVVLVPSMGRPWITRPLFVRGGTTLIFQEGAEVVSKKGAFRGGDNSLLCLRDVEDVTLSGYGARLVMRKADYRKAPYEQAQWRHAIEMYGCARVTVLGLEIESSGGDGVYLGRGTRSFNDTVTLRDLLIRDHYRQGISVISAQDLLVSNVEMSFTEGTLPSSGIDFEPNNSDERLVRCTLSRCTIRCNAGPGILVNLHSVAEGSPLVDIRVEDSVVSNFPFALMVVYAQKARGKIELLDTRLFGLQIVAPGTGVVVVRGERG